MSFDILGTSQVVTNAEARFNKSHIRKVYACLAVTCHLHFWQNDRDFLRATVVTRGWNGYRNKSQHRTSTLEKKILPPFQQGFTNPGLSFRNHVTNPALRLSPPPFFIFSIVTVTHYNYISHPHPTRTCLYIYIYWYIYIYTNKQGSLWFLCPHRQCREDLVWCHLENVTYNKVQACFLVETFYSEFSPLRASSRPGR